MMAVYKVPGASSARTSPSAFYGVGSSPPRNQLGLPVGPPVRRATPVPPVHPSGATTGAGLGATAGAAGPPPAAAPAVAAPNPFAPLTDAQIQARAESYVTGADAPIIRQITDSINARAAAAQAAVNGYTQQFGTALQGLSGIGGAGLNTAVQSQAATDAALHAALTGMGGTGAAELGAKLNAIQAPGADQAAAAAQQEGTGAANASLASGSAALSALLAQQATASNVAGKQPGVAALFGGQATRDLQAQATRDLTDRTGQITAQEPGLIQSTIRDMQGNELTKAEQRYQQGRNTIADQRAAAAAGAPDPARSKLLGYIADSAGNPLDFSPKPGIQSRPYVDTSKTGTAAKDPSVPDAHFTTRDSPFLVNYRGEVLTGKDGKPIGNPIYKPPTGKSDPLAKPDLNLTKNNSSPVILNGHGQPFLVGGKPLKYAPPSTATTKPRSREDLRVAASTGGWDAKSGALSPEMRDGIKTLTGIDPGPTATRTQMVAAGLLPKPPVVKPKATPKVKVTGTSASDKYVVTYNADGTVKSKAPNPNYVPPKARAGADPAKAKQTAIKTANQTALRVVTAGAKQAPVYGQTPKTDAFGGVVKGPDGKPIMVRTQTGERYSAAYYDTIHRIEAAVEDQLAPYMSRSEIIRFAQQKANAYYPAGRGGRPRTAAQTEKAAKTPPTFPTPKPSVRTRARRPPNPRATSDKTFPSPLKVAG